MLKILTCDYRPHIVNALMLFLASLLIIGCEQSNYNPPDDHTLSKDGIMHKSGLNDPLDSCVSCHGDDLQGGSAAVSCYECHGKKW